MDELEDLVIEFADNVAGQSKAVLLGHAEKASECAQRYVVAFQALKKRGDEGRDALAGLLGDKRPDVRVMAASCLLRHCGESARRILEQEASGRGLVALSAAQALRRWDDGTWELDQID